MPQNEQRRPDRGGAAVDSLVGDAPQHTKITDNREAPDPVRALIARLDAAAASGGPVTLDGREPIRARAIPSGFALERRT